MRTDEMELIGATLFVGNEENPRQAMFSVAVTDQDKLSFEINPVHKGAKNYVVYVSLELFKLLYARALREAGEE